MADHLKYTYGKQLVEQDDIDAVVSVLRSAHLTSGPTVARFEKKLAQNVDVEHAVSCSSGSTALYLAMKALGIDHSSTVVVPSITYVATANAARLTGASIVFSDVDRRSGLMTEKELEEACERAENRVDCIIPVHYAGQTADMNLLSQIASKYGASVVEDASHAIGTANGNSLVGSCKYSDATVFSFHPVKTIAGGEGGAVTAKSDSIAKRLRMFRENGVVRESSEFLSPTLAQSASGEVNPWYHEFHDVSLNYRLSEIHASLALSQLGKLDRFKGERRRLVEKYREMLADLAPTVVPLSSLGASEECWHLCVVLIDFAKLSVDRADVMNTLRNAGIGTQVHYIPVHLQPSYRREDCILPGAEEFYEGCLSLPLFVGMKEEDVVFIVRQLSKAIGH